MYKVEVGKWLASKMRAVVQPGAEFGHLTRMLTPSSQV